MRRLLASPRRRRRLAWLAGAVAIAATAVGIGISFKNTAETTETPVVNEPAQVAPEQREVPLTGSRRAAALRTIRRFVHAAVLGEDPLGARRLATGGLRAQATLAEWRRGEIPGVFPVPKRAYVSHDVRLMWSYAREAVFDVAVIPNPRSGIATPLATVTLKRVGTRWLVDSWGTRGALPPVAVADPKDERRAAPPPAAPAESRYKGKLGAIWMVVPGILIALIVLVPLSLLVATKVREKRVEREWRRSLSP